MLVYIGMIALNTLGLAKRGTNHFATYIKSRSELLSCSALARAVASMEVTSQFQRLQWDMFVQSMKTPFVQDR